MHLINIQNWQDGVRFLSFHHENSVITFTQIENETILVNQLPVFNSLDEAIEVGESLAKVRLYQLDGLPSLESSRQFIREQNKEMGQFLNLAPSIH